jgi:hypothetical protein
MNNINNNDEIQDFITEIEASNNGTYRESLIGTFLNEGRRTGLLESLLLVGTNMLIYDVSNNDIENNIVNRVINESFREKSKFKNVLSEEGEKQIKRVKYDADLHKNHICPIYHTEFTKDTIVSQLPCNHIFSPEGIDRWLKNENAICPVCRFKLLSYEKKIEEEQLTNREINENNENNEYTDGYILNDISYNLEFPILTNINTINNINLLNRFSYIITRGMELEEEENFQETIFNSITDN